MPFRSKTKELAQSYVLTGQSPVKIFGFTNIDIKKHVNKLHFTVEAKFIGDYPRTRLFDAFQMNRLLTMVIFDRDKNIKVTISDALIERIRDGVGAVTLTEITVIAKNMSVDSIEDLSPEKVLLT